MKRTAKTLTALGLSLALLAPHAALASEALGHDLHFAQAALSEGTGLTTGWFWSDTYSDLRTERYVTYAPNSDVVPTVAYGDTVLSRSTLTSMARKLEQAGKRVVGGINGDFYVMATGQPLGLVITDGEIRSSSSYHYAIGFHSDGTAFIGQPQLKIEATLPQAVVTVTGGINKVRQIKNADGGGLTLLTSDFGSTTGNTAPGVDVYLTILTDGLGEEDDILTPTLVPEETPAPEEAEPRYRMEMVSTGRTIQVSDKLEIGKRVRCRVEFVTEAQGANPLNKGDLVLTMNAKDDPEVLTKLRALQPGDEVDLDITSSDPRWSEAVEAVGGMYRLLENGQIGTGLSTERTARTAIGIKADGTVIFYTMDGKQPGSSVGATCEQVAKRLLELGCVDAIGLDGGGSTTIGATYPDGSSLQVVNSPSDGAQRSISNAIFLTTELKPTGTAGALSITPGDALLLSGAELPFAARVLDTAWYDMGEAAGASFTAEGAGEITHEGLFTAGSSSGSATVTASLPVGRKTVTGQSQVTVVATPDKITVKNEATGGTVQAISLEPGETISLTASARWRNLDLISQDGCYTWQCDPAVGSVTPDGTFTAGEERASGSLTVTAGGKTVTLPVNVAGHITTLADMEGENPFTSTDAAQASLETTLNNVRTGLQSLRVDYTAEPGVSARLEGDLAIGQGERYLGLWVLGDGSGASLSALVKTEGGEETALPVTALDFTGWKHVLIALPQGTAALTGLEVSGEGPVSGTIWIDQITISNEAMEDFTAPLIDLKITGRTLTAAVSDNVDQELPAGAVKVTYDGRELTGKWNAASGTLTVTLPAEDGLTHRVSVTSMDASGNLGRQSMEVGEGPTLLFEDMEDHWAAAYANYLYGQGITKGVSLEEGVLLYQPNSNITRAEFFTMIARWLGLNTESAGEEELPFDDAGDIPTWALGAVKAMYDAGILRGSLDGGRLLVRPGATITRAEAMTVLGRTQSRGYREADLSGFSDAGMVPAWAEAYVRSLVGQGVINGYEDGTVRPAAPMTRGEVAKVLYTLR